MKELTFTDFFIEIVFEFVDYLHFTYVGEDIAMIIKE